MRSWNAAGSAQQKILRIVRMWALTSPKANGSNQNAALTPPRQGFAVRDGGNGADCGEKVVIVTAT